MSTISHHKLISTAGSKSCQSLHLPKLIPCDAQQASVADVKRTHISTNQNHHHHHKHQRHHHRGQRQNPLEKFKKKPRTFGLYLITTTTTTKTNQQKKASKLHISLNYKVLHHKYGVVFRNASSSSSPSRSSSSIHCQLLPINYLRNDTSVRDHFPREITMDRLQALLLPSPMQKQSRLTQLLPSATGEHAKWKSMASSLPRKTVMKSPELQAYSDQYRWDSRRKQDIIKISSSSSPSPFLSSSPLNGIPYEVSRLKFFYDSVYQCNFPAIKYMLDRQANLVLKAIEPTSGYSLLLIALLYIHSAVKRIKLIRLFLKYLKKYLHHIMLNDENISENGICEQVLQAIDPIHGRDCIAWSCVLGYAKEFRLLFTHLVTSVNLQKRDYHGDTYLHLALIGGSLDIVNEICQYVRKYSIPIDKYMNQSGSDPIHLAAELKFDAALGMLKSDVRLVKKNSDNRQCKKTTG
ncbi:unnamed protein product [Trichobilharzia szidati]|nr:unnamed protein product [Trichobilharzia szidati]